MFSSIKHSLRYNPNKFGKKYFIYTLVYVIACQYKKELLHEIATNPIFLSDV